ncbi:c-type cytochrome [Sorangium sp. So ce131]|uniref:cytochrome c n=1 Tax=Sorangium sp. So ce131 TaxID=3133282 RepID=UPI003F5F1826
MRLRRAACLAALALTPARWLAALAPAGGLAALALAPAGCAAEAAAPLGQLAVRPVAWPAAGAELGPVRAVADAGDRVVLFHDGAAAIFVNGALARVDRAPRRWVDAATLPAPDGSGTWIVGVDSQGQLLRLRGQGSFEPVSDRYGLERAALRAARDLGGGGAAFALDGEIAVADGAVVTRYATGPLAAFAAGGGRVAFVADGLHTLDAATRVVRRYSLHADAAGPSGPGGAAPLLAVTGAGALLAATPAALYEADGAGVLHVRLRASAALHGLAVSGERVWFADGGELGALDEDGARATRGARLPRDGRLIGSPSGDVWLLAAGALRRFAAAQGADAAGGAGVDAARRAVAGGAPAWDDLEPVFARACARCHGPRGEGGVDLSTRAAWTALRDAIGRRVIDERTMPPPGHPLSEADRARIRAFVESERAGVRTRP